MLPEYFALREIERYRCGDTVMGQLKAVLIDGEPLDEQNPNALRSGLPFLKLAATYGDEGAIALVPRIEAFLKTEAAL